MYCPSLRADWMYQLAAWTQIKQFYADRVATRSQVPLIHHIIEGSNVLHFLKADMYTISAFMLHPIFQSNFDFNKNGSELENWDIKIAIRVLNYRYAANAYLCKDETDDWGLCSIVKHTGAIREGTPLWQMLVADKWQNQKDFQKHYGGKQERSAQLMKYFNNWRVLLDPDGSTWECLSQCLSQSGASAK